MEGCPGGLLSVTGKLSQARTPGESYLGFVNSTVGHWIGFGNKLWTTTDGGEHWTASNV